MFTFATPKWSIIGLLSLFIVIAVALYPKQKAYAQAEPFEAGKHYQVLETPVRTSNANKIEVIEVFWYGCGHCNNFRPIFEQWKKQLPEGVYADHSPAMWNKNMETHARVYYTAKALGIQPEIHKAVFDAIHLQKKKLLNADEIYPLFAEKGINRDKFDKTFRSFGVNSMVQQANARARGYGIAGTPEVIVNGKYRISSSMTGSQANMLKVADFLIKKELAR